jgi:uncharacterized protein involved in exopolysaccharide biosynthesis
MNAQLESILAQANTDAAASLKRVERLSKLLADAMQDIHGGAWRIQVEHEAHFVIVAMRRSQ